MRKYYQRRLPEDPSKDYYYIMRETPNTTSLLIEYGFIDNSNDVRKLNNYLLDYAEAVVRAVATYIGIPYVVDNLELDNTYTVKVGDTLYGIARKFNTTVDNIKLLNKLTSNILIPGQKLILDEEINIEPDINNGESYIVKSGDTLYKIASIFNTTVNDIIELNNLTSTILSPGQELLIPNKSLDNIGTYIVKKGDSLSSIANAFNLTVDELISSNNLTSTVLQIGQILTIPTGIEPNTNIPSYEYEEYVISPGDTLYSIARRFNTTVNDLITLNNLTSNTLSIGEVLLIPPTDNKKYIVKKGDSLWLIANNFNTTVDRLKQLNNLQSNILKIGQELIIK